MGQSKQDLMLERGRLLERVAQQRLLLSQNVRPLSASLERVDGVIEGAFLGTSFVRQHYAWLGGALLLAMLTKPQRFWRLGRRALSVWQTWRWVSARLGL